MNYCRNHWSVAGMFLSLLVVHYFLCAAAFSHSLTAVPVLSVLRHVCAIPVTHLLLAQSVQKP